MEETQKTPSSPQNYTPSQTKFITKNVVIFLSVCVLLSFSSTTYLLIAGNTKKAPLQTSQLSELSQQPSEPTSPTPTPIVEEIIDEELSLAPTPISTATWSAYVNSRYHFSYKYPPDWKIQKSTSTDPKILDYQLLYPPATASAYAISVTYSSRTLEEALAIDSTATEAAVKVGTVSGTKKRLEDSNRAVSIKVIFPYQTHSIIFYAGQAYENILDVLVNTYKNI